MNILLLLTIIIISGVVVYILAKGQRPIDQKKNEGVRWYEEEKK